MKRKVTFTIPGDPVPQGRPRFSTHGGFARAYDPKKSRDGKSVVKLCAKEAIEKAGFNEPLSGPLVMKVQFGIPLPKSSYRKRTPVERSWRTKKPDLDNLLKLVKDACSESFTLTIIKYQESLQKKSPAVKMKRLTQKCFSES